jgi:hypothetical protein
MVQQGRCLGGHRGHLDRVTIAIYSPPALPVLPARGPEVEPAWGMATDPPKLTAVGDQGAMGIVSHLLPPKDRQESTHTPCKDAHIGSDPFVATCPYRDG